ncbi:MAG TPA: nucleotide sugar dehydrogenase [Kiritimatiellia bacterium]|nr:nucleotide sugar dehydrogenase [Kiritimatiellia bacterium]
MRIAVVGCWHQGVVGAACLADMGHDVVGYDSDASRIESLRGGKAPLFEPGLDPLLESGLASGKLVFTNDVSHAVTTADVVMVMHDTPVDENDQSDLSGIFDDIRAMAGALKSDVPVYVTAQVPVGTCDELATAIRDANPAWRGGMAYSPENLRLGQAIERFRRPPLPVIGADSASVFQSLEKLLASFSSDWKKVDVRTAEMSKHALNAFLATSICFANEIGNLCDVMGADGYKLAEALRLEPRIGAKAMLFPGLGFAGGTLARDMQTLRGIGDKFGVETMLLDGAWVSNQEQNKAVVLTLKRLHGKLKGCRVAVLGLTYKPDTSTLRRSAALDVIGALNEEGAVVRAHDPKADRTEALQLGSFEFCDGVDEALRDADVLVLMTPWADYKSIDPVKVKSLMQGALVFDTANLWPADKWEEAGLTVLTIGRGRKVKS